MKTEYLYVVIEVKTGRALMVFKRREDIDDEYLNFGYSIQQVYFWK